MRFFAVLAALLMVALPARAGALLDPTPRIAVISAFPPELVALRAATTDQKEHVASGATFITGRLEGKPVVLFLSGVSMVNAAMTTQAALDRFTVSSIVFSGIAGGVDEQLNIGDVIVAEEWAQPLETIFAREVAGGGYAPAASGSASGLPNFGMMFPRSVTVARAPAPPEQRLSFPVDPALLSVARRVAGEAKLERCVKDQCLVHAPKVVVGGAGVSSSAFVDNAAYRKYLQSVFKARVLDMESAAVAQVAYANRTPFIAFRSLSDLAGGGEGANEMRTFMALASDNSAAVVRTFVRDMPAP